MMRAKIILLIIGLALLAGVHPVLAQPALGIVPTNNQFILYWPINRRRHERCFAERDQSGFTKLVVGHGCLPG